MKFNRRRFIGASAASAAGVAGAITSWTHAADTPPQTPQPVRPDKRSDPHPQAIIALSEYSAGLSFADLDAGTVAKAKQRVLDVIGCAIGAVDADANAALVDLVQVTGGAHEASIIGYPMKVPAAQAAMVNAVFARAYDFEVMTVVVRDREIESHHSPTTCMTALAMCERARLSGQHFLTALTLGDDVAARVLAASGVDFGKGWSPPPLFSSFGGTAIAGHVMKLSPAQIRNAFGMSVDQIGGTGQAIWDGATNWKLGQGLAARNAIISAELAKRGWSGMGDALQAPYGFYSQFTAGCVRPELLTDDLGKVFFAEEYFKPYPSCAATHPSIECALELRRKFVLEPDEIDTIVLRVQPSIYGIFVSKPFSLVPSAHAQANYSLAFAVANALLHGDFRLEHYAPDAMRAPQLLRLIERIAIEKMLAGQPGVELQVTTTDGRRLAQGRAGQASRYPKVNPVTYVQTVEKFHAQAQFSGRVSRKTAQQIVERVAMLEHEADMASFARLLTGHSSRL